MLRRRYHLSGGMGGNAWLFFHEVDVVFIHEVNSTHGPRLNHDDPYPTSQPCRGDVWVGMIFISSVVEAPTGFFTRGRIYAAVIPT